MMKTISRKAFLKRTTVRLIAVVMSAVVAVLSVTTIHLNAAEKSEQTITFPLPKKSKGVYEISVLSKYSDGKLHNRYLGSNVLMTGGSSMPNAVMDIAAAGGTKVYSVMDGKVYESTYNSTNGNYVVIKHTDGSYSYYGHLRDKSKLKKGAQVSSGDLVGYVGKTGSAKGNHLHFEWSGHDPYCYFKDLGYVKIMKNSGASAYLHVHKEPYTARVKNTDGSLAINPIAKAKNPVGYIPENACCTVYPDESSSKWYYVSYNGIQGYSYYKYLSRVKEEDISTEKDDKSWKDSELGTVTTQPNQITAPPQTTTATEKEKWYENIFNPKKEESTTQPPVSEATPSVIVTEPEPEPETVSSYTAYAAGTDGSLAINSKNSVGYGIGEIPEGAACTVYPDRSIGNWLYVYYRGTEGYSYGKYLTKKAPVVSSGKISGTDGSLAINKTPSSKYCIGEIPEGEYCTVYDDIRSGNWVWVEYNGIFGYSYSKYIK